MGIQYHPCDNNLSRSRSFERGGQPLDYSHPCEKTLGFERDGRSSGHSCPEENKSRTLRGNRGVGYYDGNKKINNYSDSIQRDKRTSHPESCTIYCWSLNHCKNERNF